MRMEDLRCFNVYLVCLSEPSGPVRRDRAHIEDTLRLSAAEPSAEFTGEDATMSTSASPANTLA